MTATHNSSHATDEAVQSALRLQALENLASLVQTNISAIVEAIGDDDILTLELVTALDTLDRIDDFGTKELVNMIEEKL